MASMLPWRRSKFVLVAEGEAGYKEGWLGKSLGGGPALSSYCSLLSHLARACPDLLWPPWCRHPPLERLGGLFRSRRRTVELNREEPVYTAWYLGNAVTLQAKGEACTDEAVEKIWAKSQAGGRATPMKLAPGPHGLRLSPADPRSSSSSSRRPAHAYLLARITYCGADRRRPQILAWVYRHQVKNKAVVLRCHAVMLSTAEKAQAVARLLRQTSRSAFSEFKRLKRQEDARHRQRQLLGEAVLPRVPLRRLLNGRCPYRPPPPDRNRSGPRLSAIREEEEEEEEEERAQGDEGRRPAPPATTKTEQIQARGLFCSHRAAVAGAVVARFSIGAPEGARVVLFAPGPLGAPSPVSSAVAACLSLSTTEGLLSSRHAAPGHGQAGKLARGRERPEVLSLARDLSFCTLRGPLPQVDTLPPWDGSREPPCLPC